MIIFPRVLICLFWLLASGIAVASQPWENELRIKSAELVGAKLKKMPSLIVNLEDSREFALPMLRAMLEGNLQFQKSDKKLVIIVSSSAGEISVVDAVTGEILPVVEKKALKKIRVNNKLRIQIRQIISRITIGSKDASLRKKAVENILNNLTDENIILLSEVKQKETDTTILSLINLAIAINNLSNSIVPEVRLSALDEMSGNLEPLVFNTLSLILDRHKTGVQIEQNHQVLKKIQSVHSGILFKNKLYGLAERVYYGLSLGSVLLLIAMGLEITFGVMRVINMAHGELIMLGAYTTYVVQQCMPNDIEYSIFLAIPCAFLVSGSVGILIERFVIRFLRGRPLETLLATFGVSLILQQAVRTLFSPLNRQVVNPDWLSGSLEINPIFSLTYNRLYILIFALIIFACLQLLLRKTELGLHVRAVSQNREMAKSLGIKTDRVDAMTFGLGSGIAGLAGVALSQITNVGPNLGQAYIIDSFMVVVFGGVGNLYGTLVGGFSLGVMNKFLEPAVGAVLSNIFVLVFIVLFIQIRPSGLFPQRGRAAR